MYRSMEEITKMDIRILVSLLNPLNMHASPYYNGRGGQGSA